MWTQTAWPGSTRVMTEREAIDVHAHVMPMGILEQLAADGRADLSEISSGRLRIDEEISGVAPGNVIPFAREQYDQVARREVRAASGVTGEAVSIPPFLFASESRDPDLVIALARACNDALHEYVRTAGPDVHALYFVPVGHPEAAAEARRCIETLGGAGVTIGSYGLGRELDDRVNEELWSYLAGEQVFISLHPSRASGTGRLRDYHLLQLFGYPVETGLAASRLIFSGVLDRHDLRICLAHGGGCLLGLAPRLDLGWERKDTARTSQDPPRAYLDRFWYDTAVFDRQALTRLIDEVGVGQVLLGTDFPFDLADTDPLPSILDSGRDRSEQDAILSTTARRLLRTRVTATSHNH